MADIIVKYPSLSLYPSATGLYPTKKPALWIFDQNNARIRVSSKYNSRINNLPDNDSVATTKKRYDEATTSGKRSAYRSNRN